MRNLVAKIVSVFAVVFMSMNALGSGEDVTIMIAGVDGTIHFSVDYASDAFLLAGFEEAPLVLDVTNEEAPFIVDYVSVEIGTDTAAYAAFDTGASVYAATPDSFIEVNEIDLY